MTDGAIMSCKMNKIAWQNPLRPPSENLLDDLTKIHRELPPNIYLSTPHALSNREAFDSEYTRFSRCFVTNPDV